MVLAVLVLPRYKRGMKIVLSWLQDYLTFHQPVDVPALCALLVRLDATLAKRTPLEAETRAHLADSADTLRQALSATIQRQAL